MPSRYTEFHQTNGYSLATVIIAGMEEKRKAEEAKRTHQSSDGTDVLLTKVQDEHYRNICRSGTFSGKERRTARKDYVTSILKGSTEAPSIATTSGGATTNEFPEGTELGQED